MQPDSGGLYQRVNEAGTKSWIFRFTQSGKLRAEIRNRSIPARLRSGSLEQRTRPGGKNSRKVRLQRPGLLGSCASWDTCEPSNSAADLSHRSARCWSTASDAGVRPIQYTAARALGIASRPCLPPTHRVLCAGPGQGIQGSSKPRPGGLGGSLSPAPSRGRSPSCAGCALCRASIFWTEHTSGPERRASDRRSPSACGMLIVTARWSPPPPRTSLKRSRRASPPAGISVFKRKAPAETGTQGEIELVTPAMFPSPLPPPKVSFKLCNPHAHRLGGAGGCFR